MLAQVDIEQYDNCYFPQVEAFEQIVSENPSATFVLNYRQPEHWLGSVNSWNSLRQRLISCDISTLPKGVGGKDEEMLAWFEDHYESVRQWFASNPTYKMIEFDIESEDAGSALEQEFGISASCWACSNANPSSSNGQDEDAKLTRTARTMALGC